MASRWFAQDHIRRCEKHVGRCGSDGAFAVAEIVHPALSLEGSVGIPLDECARARIKSGLGGKVWLGEWKADRPFAKWVS